MSLCDTRKAMKIGATNVEKRSLKTKHLAPIFRAEMSGHVALRHPQSNENGRYERGEALTENKALSAYFQGRDTQMRCPRMHGLPKQIPGLMVILERSSSRVIQYNIARVGAPSSSTP